MCLLQLEGKKLVVNIGSTCVLLVNAAGDIANIFIFKKGVVGMAAATSAANIIACIFLGTVFFRKSKLFHFSLQRIRKHLSARIMKNGLPSLAYYGSLVIRNAFMNMLIITTLGRDVLVSMLVFTSFGTIADVLIGGHSDSVLVLGGVLYGEKDKKSAASLLRISIISGSILMLIVTVMTTIFSVPMAKLFLNQNDIAFAPEAGSALFLASFYLIPDIISCIEKKYIQSIGNGMYTAVTNVLYNVICVCIIAFILTKIIGTDGLFLSFTGCYLIAAIVNSIYIVFFSFKRFDVPGACTESFSITNLDECIEASEKVRNYSRLKGIDSRRSLLLGLFVEEIGKNIINYGFKKHHNSSIIVKLSITNDSVTLNIKDNCVLFDPTKFYDTMRNDESAREKSIGIRMLMELSGKVTYTTSFNLNNLLIEV
jgi:anti-sigma regulatory factor (Ser/Thr protein kinase)